MPGASWSGCRGVHSIDSATSLSGIIKILFDTYFVYKIVLKFRQRYITVLVEVNVQKLSELRQRRVLTLRELEARSGVAYNTIWRLENGKTGAQPRTIRKLAAALGVEPEELVKVVRSDA